MSAKSDYRYLAFKEKQIHLKTHNPEVGWQNSKSYFYSYNT